MGPLETMAAYPDAIPPFHDNQFRGKKASAFMGKVADYINSHKNFFLVWLKKLKGSNGLLYVQTITSVPLEWTYFRCTHVEHFWRLGMHVYMERDLSFIDMYKCANSM